MNPEFSRQDRKERKDELGQFIAPNGLGQNIPEMPPGGFREIPCRSWRPLRASGENCNVWDESDAPTPAAQIAVDARRVSLPQ